MQYNIANQNLSITHTKWSSNQTSHPLSTYSPTKPLLCDELGSAWYRQRECRLNPQLLPSRLHVAPQPLHKAHKCLQLPLMLFTYSLLLESDTSIPHRPKIASINALHSASSTGSKCSLAQGLTHERYCQSACWLHTKPTHTAYG